MSDKNEVIVLYNAMGEEQEFEFLDLIQYRGDQYAILISCDDDPEEPGLVDIFKVEPGRNGEDDAYTSVEDETVLNEIFAIFRKKHSDDFQFVD